MKGNIIGERLRKLREEAHLSQKQLAERTWLSTSVISGYELGTRTPSADVIIKLASYFHVSTDYLLGIEKKTTLDTEGLTDEDIVLLNHTIQVLRDKNKKAQP